MLAVIRSHLAPERSAVSGEARRLEEVLRFEKAKEQADTEALRQQRIGYIL